MTMAVSWSFMVGLDKQRIDTESSKISSIASRFQESMNVHRKTGDSTAVTLHQSFFLYFTYFTLVNNIIYKIK